MDTDKKWLPYFASICLGIGFVLLSVCTVLLIHQNNAIDDIRTSLTKLEHHLAVSEKLPSHENASSHIPLPKSTVRPMSSGDDYPTRKKAFSENPGRFRLLSKASELSVPDNGITLLEEP